MAELNKFRDIMLQVPTGMVVFSGPDFYTELANEKYLQLVDKREDELVGHNLLEAIPELHGQGIEELLRGVLTTGIPYEGTEFKVELKRAGKIEETWFNFVYQPLRDENGVVTGVIVIATEVTDLVKSKRTVAESARRFRNLVMQSPIAMAIFRGTDLVIDMANEAMLRLWKRAHEDVTGRKLLDVFPELENQKFPDLLLQVFQMGLPYRESEALAYVDTAYGMQKLFVDYVYEPLYEVDGSIGGVIATVVNVTQQVESREKIQDAESRSRLAIEAANLGTFEWNLETREFIYSPRLAEIFGFGADEQVGHLDLVSRFRQQDVAVRNKAHEQALVTGLLSYEACVIWPDLTAHWLQIKGKVKFDEAGTPLRIYGTGLDITDQRLAMAEIAEREARFRLLADFMPQLIWTSDEFGDLNYFNKAVYDYSGYTEDEMSKKGWVSIVHPDEREENIKRWIESVTTGADFIFEHRFKRNDGVYRWQLSRALAQKDDNGKVQMWIGTSTDIHDRKMMTDELEKHVEERTSELKKANEDLLRTNYQLEQFAYIASHDLQEPLRKIRTFTQMLIEDGNDPAKSGKYLEKISSSANRMSSLIKDVLNYSRLIKIDDVFTPTDLNEVFKNVLSDYELLIEQKQATVTSTALPVISGIPLQLNQLFSNLIGNALKFTEDKPLIQLTAETPSPLELNGNASLYPSQQYVKISFKDNGIGFDQHYADKIFTIFQRLNERAKYEGTGIGLALCKKIVENHHGFITATSEPGKGATFNVYLPVQ